VRSRADDQAFDELAREHGKPRAALERPEGRGTHVSRTGVEQRRLSVYLPLALGDEVLLRAARARKPYSALIEEVLAAAFARDPLK
jgi:hypothetical protein